VPYPDTPPGDLYTPVSAYQSYITPDDFFNLVDIDLIAQVYSSNGVPLTRTQLETDPRLLAALQAASGKVESTLLKGGRYSAQSLAALTGVSREFFNKLVADTALAFVYEYRDGMTPPDNVRLRIDRAEKLLTRLADGSDILSFSETVQAGQPLTYMMNFSDKIRRNYLTTDLVWRPYWGMRQDLERGAW
jgi:hypothetical protein